MERLLGILGMNDGRTHWDAALKRFFCTFPGLGRWMRGGWQAESGGLFQAGRLRPALAGAPRDRRKGLARNGGRCRDLAPNRMSLNSAEFGLQHVTQVIDITIFLPYSHAI
ncbi:hypothetical protein ABLE93_09810 [Xanthobacter sp. KR7-65]|uniref:hypothetical protein n=1 Tax=Xanthobacter sp. KR7-65 TaxID=3156612 RepID=UPI0032B5C063